MTRNILFRAQIQLVQASLKYEEFEDIVSDLQLRHLASSRVIAISCLESVLEETDARAFVLMGVSWTRVDEMNATGSKRVHVTVRSFESFLVRLSEHFSTEQNKLHQVRGVVSTCHITARIISLDSLQTLAHNTDTLSYLSSIFIIAIFIYSIQEQDGFSSSFHAIQKGI